ncbi:unnamed protein product [Polarella glacialis]|nr:unnamed protein product [Polarella glacialis]
MLAENDIHVAFVDASHRYEHVISDMSCALSLPLVKMLVFDDYGLIRPVREAVDSYRQAGRLHCDAIGEDMEVLLRVPRIAEAGRWWNLTGAGLDSAAAAFGFAFAAREGLVCKVLQRGPAPRWEQAVVGQHFACYRLESVGEVTLRLDFTFKLDRKGFLKVFWPEETGRQPAEVPWSLHHKAYQLNLQADTVPELAPHFVFNQWLRRGLLIRGDEPEHVCLPVGDANNIFKWTIEDVLLTLTTLQGSD